VSNNLPAGAEVLAAIRRLAFGALDDRDAMRRIRDRSATTTSGEA
jgi:hypothetical protein